MATSASRGRGAWAAAVLALLGLALSACGPGGEVADAGAGDGAAQTDAVVGADRGPSADAAVADAMAGAAPFEIELHESRSAGGGAGMAYADVLNPRLSEMELMEVARRGACAYYEPWLNPLCDPPCPYPQHCDAQGQCQAPPQRFGAGPIDVSGLLVGLHLEPQQPYGYYLAQFDPEPVDGELFDGNSQITAVASGDTVPAFSVSAGGVEALSTDLACPPPLVAGTALQVVWPAASGGARLRFSLSSGNHAAMFPQIVCDSDDVGALEVDADLIDLYLATLRPVDRWVLQRSVVGATEAGGHAVRLLVASSVGCQY